MEMLRKFVLVGVMVLVEPGTILQISIGTLFCAAYLMVQQQAVPYTNRANGFLAVASSFSLLMFYFCCTVYKFDALTSSSLQEFMSEEQQRNYVTPDATFSVILFLSVLGSLLFAGVLVVVHTVIETTRILKPKWGVDLPTCEWHIKQGQEFSCFLSHYKVEAGAEARYLKDSLDKMLSCPAYLDSSALADLRELFVSGVRPSEVLVLLLTKGLLARPWCLLEVREAVRLQKPIVLLELKGPGQSFSFDDAFALLSDLESNLPPLNPWAIGELRAQLKEEPLSELQETVREALEMGRAAGVLHFNINGTANQLEAELYDLVERLAVTTGRTVAWKGGQFAVLRRSSAKKRLSDHLIINPRMSDTCGRKSILDRVSSATQRASGRWSLFQRSSGNATTNTRTSSMDASGATYIIHEPDAEPHALRLQQGMTSMFVEPCHLEVPSSPEDMHRCLERVAQSTSVLLLQTPSVLMQPWALLSMYRAALTGVPVVCVAVAEGGYDFGEAKLHLEHLSERLDAPALEQISDELSRWDPPRVVEALQSKLARLIPLMISVTYKPNGTEHKLMATIRDVGDKRRLLRNRRRNSSFQDGTSARRGSLLGLSRLGLPGTKTLSRRASTLSRQASQQVKV